ncbi:murein biosynthesis integral membrane protein MurJ [Oecophyllibacter saccharovorans]|uniref:murein biosynthesis integral membrane protein MurJ n=1 Tax=Oecophyllibacter saccharovorans TaxID=2558360 RepID=UPI00114130C9|nr:murein biosynthesis integral membrane protein MurJ [Oecophyllibacter saccharovorans]QDH15703.1 murein biosynthesis integral membrane protein MurJ [Oecophyllibacter saccharovorans]
MLRSLLTVGGWTMISRLLGLVRDQLLAFFLGAGGVQDAYQIAFRLPNMFRRLFGEGAFNAAFIPLFTGIFEKEGRSKALLFAGRSLSMLVVWLVFLTVLGEIFMPQLIDVLAPGFRHGNLHRYQLAVQLTRITLPYMVLICAAALVAGMLNGRNHFSAASAAYVTFNIVGILSILAGAWYGHDDIAQAGAWGITLSGVLQLALLLWAAARHHILPPLCWPVLSHNIRLLLRRMAPGLVGSGVTQLNLTVDTIIATLLPTGSISWLYFADRVNQLPLGVLGAALGTTLLPLLSRHASGGDRVAMRESLDQAMTYALLPVLPATAGLLATAPLIMSTLFGYGHFTLPDVVNSAGCLRAYALGLPAFVIIKLLAPAFFAEGDTTTPVRVGLMTLALNLALNLAFYRPLAWLGPPLASAAAALVNMSVLMVLLYRRDLFRPDRRALSQAGRILLAAVLMGLCAWAVTRTVLWDLPHWHGLLARLIGLMCLIGLSGGLYAFLLLALRVVTPAQLRSFAERRLNRRRG